MNITTTRGRGKVHTPAPGATTARPLCLPPGGRHTYRTTAGDVTCTRCTTLRYAEPPQEILDFRDVVLVTQDAARQALFAERSAAHTVRITTPGTPAGRIAASALTAAKAAREPTEHAWHAAVAAFIVVHRLVRAAGAPLAVDDIETMWADVPQVAALIAAHETN